MSKRKTLGARALVIGGSMVGLAVARVLGESFDEVVVVERDSLARDQPQHRRGVPQSYHIHNLTLRGQRELEALFPGFGAEAVRLGAVQIDHGSDVARCTVAGFQTQFQSDFVALSATRALLEFAERSRFLALVNNAVLLTDMRVTELLVEARGDGPRAVGVRTDSCDRPEIRADLVVDCSGRAALWKKWFVQHGLPLPRETVVDSKCGYSSRFVRPRDPERYPWKALTVDSVFPQQPHWGVIVPLEHGEWVITLGGFNGDYPPTDEPGFQRFARSLLTPLYAEALEDAEPLTLIRPFRGMEMRWNHFESGKLPLSRFLVLGDAAFAYNPLYGQGMSIGVTCARILRDELQSRPRLDGLAARLYPQLKSFAFPYWEGTALNDMRWPGTVGTRPWTMPILQKLGVFLLEASHYEKDIMRAILASVHMLKPPLGMVRSPRVLLALVRFATRRLLSALPPGDHAQPVVE
ncbi:MAG: monooxygenase FAD-binding protein [Myxococcaceae bacterium]|nr:monooxygenase FAD-binding protein [Myxococcaceae bacterium]